MQLGQISKDESMVMGKRMKQAVIIGCFLLSLIAAGAIHAVSLTRPDGAGKAGRPDVISIDTAGESKTMPLVRFYHDRHTEALQGKTCETCHLVEDSRYVFQFKQKRQADLTVDQKKDLFHDNCVACHLQTKQEGRKSGPEAGQCRTCHVSDQKASMGYKIKFDKSLHYRHVSSDIIKAQAESDADNCSACHHLYDESMQKTVYAKGKESSCRYCHLPESTPKVRSMQSAVHDDCVNCHQENKALLAPKTGPVECQGCHDPKKTAEIKKLADVPRMKRNQPDNVLLATGMIKALENRTETRPGILPVAFNHQGHEKGTESCRVCHHASLEKCSECHTAQGKKKGDFVQLEQAMHRLQTDQSCVGCHENAARKNQCAGCHGQMPAGKLFKTSCRHCHNVDIPSTADLPQTEEARNALAQKQISMRTPSLALFTETDVPKTVTIDAMVNEYEAVKMPHLRIVNALMADLKKDAMGQYFHREKFAMCQGCHHNSPMTENKPPKCASCHGSLLKSDTGDRPGLKGAYHGQCIRCHDRMGIEKPAATACNECHKKRDNS